MRLIKRKNLAALLMATVFGLAGLLTGCSAARSEEDPAESPAELSAAPSAEASTEILTEFLSAEDAGELLFAEDRRGLGERFIYREGALDMESMDISDGDSEEISRAVSEMEMVYRSDPSGPQVNARDWSIYSSRIATQKMSSAEIAFFERLDLLCQRYINDSALDGDLNEKYGWYVTDGVEYSDLGLTQEQAVAVLQWFVYNNPQYYFIRGGCLATSSKLHLKMYPFAADGAERADITNELFDKLDGWIEAVEESASSTWQKEVLANNLLCEALAYNYDALDEDKKELLWMCQSLYSSVMEQETVCTGYAKAFCAMMSALDVDVTLALSTGHAWNVVLFDDGNYYAVDVCWNDADQQDPPYNNRYLNVGDADSKARDNDRESHTYGGSCAAWIPAIAQDSYSPTIYDTSTVKVLPDAPGNIQIVERGTDTIRFSWDEVEGADQYHLAVFEDDSYTGTIIEWRRNSATSGLVSGLKPNKIYYYGVRSVKIIDGREYYSDWTCFMQITIPELSGMSD